MRLILFKETRAEPVDRVQYRVPCQNIADPLRHHSRHIENPRAEIQQARQLRPDLVPRFGECIDDCVDETAPTAEQPHHERRGGCAEKIVRQGSEPGHSKAGQ
jgi:hypothetical protein